MAVKLANAGSVMPAYHDIDNQPGHSDSFLLTTVLREQWGFDGIIVADYGGVSLLHQHHGISHDAAESAALAFNAGLDVELPKDDCARHLTDAVERGLISMAKVDEIVGRVLTEKFRLGLFENPYADENGIDLQNEMTRQVAREVATKSVTLLENNGILPLNGKPRVALVGPTADDPLALLSGYSFPVHLIISDMVEETSQVTTPRAALEHYLGASQVRYAKGCHIIEKRMPGARRQAPCGTAGRRRRGVRRARCTAWRRRGYAQACAARSPPARSAGSCASACPWPAAQKGAASTYRFPKAPRASRRSLLLHTDLLCNYTVERLFFLPLFLKIRKNRGLPAPNIFPFPLQLSICFPKNPANVCASVCSDSVGAASCSPMSSMTQPIRSPSATIGAATPRW